MQWQQMTCVAADDDVRVSCCGQCKVLVVVCVPAHPHALDRLDPCGCHDDDVQDLAPALDRDEPVELRAEHDVAILVLDLLRQDHAMGVIHRAKQYALRDAVLLKGG
jgi:hypothetical protein